MDNDPHWTALAEDDLPSVLAIAAELHPAFPERLETFAEKQSLFPEGCRKLTLGGVMAGYAFAYPWHRSDFGPLDTLFGSLPKDPGALYVHDVAILPQGRGVGAGLAVMTAFSLLARDLGLPCLSLVAVYGTQALWARAGFVVTEVPALAARLAALGAPAVFMTAPVDR